MGFAGAFAALADDATAAFANPAGLVQLTKREVSAEMRQWSYSGPFTVGGRLSGSPTGLLLDTTAGLRFGTTSETVAGLSFASFVLPGDGWAVAFYTHQTVNFEAATETQGLFRHNTLAPLGTEREDDFRISTDLEIGSYGVSGAYRLTDRLSFGVTVVFSESEMTSRRDLFLPLPPTLPSGRFGPNTYLPAAREISAVLGIDDSDVTVSAGVLWQLAEQWSAGAFYRGGPEFDMSIANVTGPAEMDLPVGTVRSFELVPVEFPAVFGVGLAYRSADDRVTIGVEWDRVQYSDLLNGFERTEGGSEFAVDDGDEIRVGGEYAFLGTTPAIAVRLGIWLDPDHRIRFTGDDDLEQALFRPSDDALHYAGGIGFVFQTFQLDLGLDFSDFVDTASLSAIYSF